MLACNATPLLASAVPHAPGSQTEDLAASPLVLAYYYIWYTPSSWSRAKVDLPLLGSYDSSDAQVIAQQIRWAQDAGIDGFIVSWKHEARLDTPLKLLVDEADRQHFKLVLLYEGLDFNRDPIGAQKVADDLRWFEQTYANDPAFDVFDRPAVIWSGSWAYTPQEIASVRTAIGAPTSMLLLGSERSAAAYQARETLFDGDAYYWSSGDPLATPGYQNRLDNLAGVVRADGGRWIAPAAPGFDARLVGGTSIVDRRNGATYRASWAAALASQPDALGIISWNEFSENSYIEPSQAYQFEYLGLTAKLTGGVVAASPQPFMTTAPGPVIDVQVGGTDSSELPARVAANQQLYSWIVTIGLLGIVLVLSLRARARGHRP
jgi:Glycosyl hydrolase family 99